MKILTLLISARAYGVETLLELVILDILTKPEHTDTLTGKSNLTLGALCNHIGDEFRDIAASAAHLETLGLLHSRKLFNSPRSILIELTPKGKKLMFGEQVFRSKQLGLRLTR